LFHLFVVFSIAQLCCVVSVRTLQLPGPVLLEGSPGVGKSSLIEALARASGYNLVRINLSEQTDLADLFGQDLPTTSGRSEGSFSEPPFSWVDGALLKVCTLLRIASIARCAVRHPVIFFVAGNQGRALGSS
jgi:midasin (ATPase involved in ribosome maturation)